MWWHSCLSVTAPASRQTWTAALREREHEIVAPDSDGGWPFEAQIIVHEVNSVEDLAQLGEPTPHIPHPVRIAVLSDEMSPADAIDSGIEVVTQASAAAEEVDLHIRTAEKRYEERSELQVQNASLTQKAMEAQLMFEGVHDALIIFRPEGEKVLAANTQACRLYGYPKEAFVGMSLEDISVNVDNGRDHIQSTLQQGIYHRFEILQRQADGTQILVEISASIIEYSGELAILSINRDLTESREAENVLRQHEGELRALQRLQTVEQLSTKVAHDFRDILNVILMSTGLLERRVTADHPGRSQIKEIAAATERGSALVERLALFGTSRLQEEMGPIRLPDVMNDVLPILRRAVGTDIVLEWEPSADLPPIYGHRNLLQQILLDLMTGISTLPSRPHRIRLVTRTESTEVTLRVFAEPTNGAFEALREAFTPLSILADDKSAVSMGLSVVRTVMEQMGGDVTVGPEKDGAPLCTLFFALAR